MAALADILPVQLPQLAQFLRDEKFEEVNSPDSQTHFSFSPEERERLADALRRFVKRAERGQDQNAVWAGEAALRTLNDPS